MRTRSRLVGPGVLALLVVLLAAFAGAVAAGGTGVIGADHQLDQALRVGPAAQTPLGRAVAGTALLITRLGTPWLCSALALLVCALWSRFWRTPRPLRVGLLSVGLNGVAVTVGKAALHRPGPPGRPVSALLGYFPSGHTATALVCASTLGLLLTERHPGWARRCAAAAIAWTGLVAAALLAHRFHWLSDVTAGALLGSAVVWTVFGWPDLAGRAAFRPRSAGAAAPRAAPVESPPPPG